MTTTTMSAVEELTLTINEEIHVKATPEVVFEALLEQLGPGMLGREDKPMPLQIEAWPGGRWYRDLGDGNGHLWAHVQAIKRAELLEFYGPLMMSAAAVSNVQYRLSAVPGGTLIKFHHFALGVVSSEFKLNITNGWKRIHERVAQRAEAR
ncbi:MAG TPA: SRPBCC domain-containing protein [Terriglobales bacterium]|jgi:hypothetical protein